MASTPFIIRNDQEPNLALLRAEDLAGCIDTSSEERELSEICEAIEIYTDQMNALRRKF